ncbi:hypothetical protein D3C81_11300 [compost metagenome]
MGIYNLDKTSYLWYNILQIRCFLLGGKTMDKCCLTCKFFSNGECKNKEFNSQVGIKLDDEGHFFVEDGTFAEVLKEEDKSILALGDMYVDELKRLKQLKKAFIEKQLDKLLDLDDIKDNVITILEELFLKSLKVVSQTVEISPKIYEPRDFYCCFWE